MHAHMNVKHDVVRSIVSSPTKVLYNKQPAA